MAGELGAEGALAKPSNRLQLDTRAVCGAVTSHLTFRCSADAVAPLSVRRENHKANEALRCSRSCGKVAPINAESRVECNAFSSMSLTNCNGRKSRKHVVQANQSSDRTQVIIIKNPDCIRLGTISESPPPSATNRMTRVKDRSRDTSVSLLRKRFPPKHSPHANPNHHEPATVVMAR